MNSTRVDLLIQYVLALASQLDDWKDRSLGPIHFIKYLYLGDLAYAKRNGESFTGINWRFHNYGPWSNDVYQRLEPALGAIGAQKKLIPSKFNGEDFARWSISRSDLAENLERDIPLPIYIELKKDVRQFSNDTSSLLHHVYQTLPMLTAAPGEDLDLLMSLPVPVEDDVVEIIEVSCEEQTSNNEMRRRQAKVRELKLLVNQKIAERILQKNKAKLASRPEYNEVFFRGVDWLDSLSGQPIEEVEGIAEISSAMWKSPARFDPDVS